MSRFQAPSIIDGFGLKADGSRPLRGELVAIPFGDSQTIGIFVGHSASGVDWIAYEAKNFDRMAARFDELEARQAANREALATVNIDYSGVGEQTDEDRQELEDEAKALRIQSSIRVYWRNGAPSWIPEDEGGVVDSLAADFCDFETREDVYAREEVALLSATPTATVAELVAWSKIADLTDGSIVAICDASGAEELYAFWDGFPDNNRLDWLDPYNDGESGIRATFRQALDLAEEARR